MVKQASSFSLIWNICRAHASSQQMELATRDI